MLRRKRAQTSPILLNEYANGETQRVSQVDFPGRVWEFTEDLSAADWDTLAAFYESHAGVIPFIFYDLSETFPLFTSDPTGTALDGQYIGKFDGALEASIRKGARATVNLRVIEVV